MVNMADEPAQAPTVGDMSITGQVPTGKRAVTGISALTLTGSFVLPGAPD